MDHQEALEQLELAAVEHGGLDRLMAGDTPSAAAIAGHLAGCPSCATEFERLQRAEPLLRDVVRTTPDPELRARTLAYVRANGMARGTAARTGAEDDPLTATAPAAIAPSGPRVGSRPGIGAWLAATAVATAAAVVISVAITTMIVSGPRDEQLAARSRAIGGLEAVTTATLALTTDPTVQRVELAATGSMAAHGSLLYSPTSDRLVVVAAGLEPPPAAQEYRCWVVIDGARVDIGRMNFADDLAFWVGDSPQVAAAPPGSGVGVSLTEVGGSDLQAEPVIAGER
jgi:Anti-sigma-K factor rskA, C-terminal